MSTVQPGILALGSSHHSYLMWDLVDGVDERQAVQRLLEVAAAAGSPASTLVVVGFRPELWDRLGEQGIDGLTGFNEPVVGDDGFTMPATQHDAVVWIQSSSRDAVFDRGMGILQALDGLFQLVDCTDGWVYCRNKDLTGFVDGTENPAITEAPGIVAGDTGNSVLLIQRWPHKARRWTSLPTGEQEKVIGRTKGGDEELDPQVETSHVARTDQEDHGDILRRNTAYGDVALHGTMFVGFASSKDPMQSMLESMAGKGCPRDALTRYSSVETGGYYLIPSAERIAQELPEDDD
ncbi:Dyp-type peroxidase [Cutibacterium sp.]|uniref:Dyp-type peroxidase n=1 Tax=Cutibacterium sp. TaxID=1912221 RepID=UPI0026DB4D7F|nr:Dyp-type peroxidase [Cutibacterium sp.]MDO4412614.1 Dyp-type peroxidase [Cutibacterium sp.]